MLGRLLHTCGCGFALLTLVACSESSPGTARDAATQSMVAADAGDHSDVESAPDSAVQADMMLIQADPERTAFALPIHPEDRAEIQNTLVIGVDHDPVPRGALECRSFADRGFPACYDGHEGTDFIVWGGFDRVDVHDVRVVAAAPGLVVRVVDGNYDRCHVDFSTGDVSCDGHPMRSNRVHIRHDDGLESRYLHLKRGSLVVAEGDTVRCGEMIALVGSSGRSAAPHLHFEIVDALGAVLDPYAGPVTGHASYWTQQDGGDGMPGSVCTIR